MPATAFAASLAAAALALPLAVAAIPDPGRELPRLAMIAVAGATVDFPLPGQYLRDGRVVVAPRERAAVPAFAITVHHVSRGDYARCVAAGACAPLQSVAGPDDAPVTGASFRDATAYAAWLTRVTGEAWRLPTALETAAAAAERFVGDGEAVADDPLNPAARWLSAYRAAAAADRLPDPAPKPRGHYGTNSVGLADFGGNVWEWTTTCYSRVTLADDGGPARAIENCGVRVIEGRHRSYMTDFVRDPKAGGCAVGTPPDNLGFRLVREAPPVPAVAWVKRRLAWLTA
jgi:formylglycine-generating enzyme required for sulfatase activity